MFTFHISHQSGEQSCRHKIRFNKTQLGVHSPHILIFRAKVHVLKNLLPLELMRSYFTPGIIICMIHLVALMFIVYKETKSQLSLLFLICISVAHQQ